MYERCDGASVTVFKFTINNLMRFILFNPDSEWFKACDPLTLESFGFGLIKSTKEDRKCGANKLNLNYRIKK